MAIKYIHDITNMQPEAIELLESAGYMDAKTIFDHTISDITIELIKANKVLEIIDSEPSVSMVSQWIKPIEKELGRQMEKDDLPEIDTMLLIEPKDILNTPFAVPVSKKFIKEHHIDLDELPTGTVRFLEEEHAIQYYSGKKIKLASHNVNSAQSANQSSTPDKTALLEDTASTSKDTQILDKSRILKMERFQKEGSSIPTIQNNAATNLTKTTKKETNEGVSPQSKFYIKGVLHKTPTRFKWGCRALLLVHFLVLLSFIITALIFVDKESYRWAVYAPLLGILGIFIYFSSAQKASCPVCNQKQFAPKRCLKHKSAHHWPIFGYMLPTAIHALLFKWFRCIFCGTSVRLKE